MQPFTIIQERHIGFDRFGKRSESLCGYIKIDESINEFLSRLSGAPLSFFMCVCAHEPSVCLKKESPYTRQDIARITHYSERALRYAEKILLPDFLIVSGTNARGEKLFRPNGAVAWFGDDTSRGAKIATLTTIDSGSGKPTTMDGRDAKRHIRGGKKARNCTSVVVEEVDQSLDKETSSSDYPAREILREAGFFGDSLNLLGRMVAPECAERWATWIRWAKIFRAEKYQSPAGIARYHLLKDCQAEPPCSMQQIEADLSSYAQELEMRERILNGTESAFSEESIVTDQAASPRNDAQQTESRYRRDGIADIWHSVLSELQLQMTKAVFDTWVRPTCALGWDDAPSADTQDVLVVGVHSPYAKEWLENRLATTVQRTLTGIIGHAVTVRYEVANGCER